MYIFKYIHRKCHINPTNILEITHIFVNMFRVVLDLTRVVLCQQSRVEINFFFKHEYQPLPQNVTEAVILIYTDLGHKKVLKRCWFFHTKQRKLHQLIWKIVDITTNIATSIFYKVVALLILCDSIL